MKFGAYEILYELKSGGMGAVLLGRRRGPGAFEQLVAIKTIRPEFAGSAHVRAMFLDEAAILAKLNHPGIATVHDFGEEAGTLYMVMEYVAGIPFRDFADLRPPPAIAARAMAEACRGLNAAHEARDLDGHLLGLVHRDISPDNLMLGFDGHVKVIDFGIALVKNRQQQVTEFGTVKGKPPYMSPEQVSNEAMDRRSDVWALGVVLHELLTGEPLFDGDSILAIAMAVAQRPLSPPGSGIPELDAAVMGALDRDLETRTPTAAAFAEALAKVAAAETLESWAARALASARDEHRAWLQKVVSGNASLPRAGRPTSEHTALAMPATPPQPEPALTTHLPAVVDDDVVVVRRNRAPLLVGGLLALIAVALVIFLASRKASTVPPADAAPRPGDAAVVVDAPRDAGVDAELLVVLPPDAAVHTQRRDAGVIRVRPDAAVARPDAAVVVQAPHGVGTADILSAGTYRNVSIDGKSVGPTPINKRKLAAGPHTIEFLDPETNQVVATKQIVVEDGVNQRVTP